MIVPRRAPVKPRVVCAATGAVLPLEDEIRELLDASKTGSVQIVGDAGMGKTAALEHLATCFSPAAAIALFDEPSPVQVAQAAHERLVIYTSSLPGSDRPTVSYRLAPWGSDEWIEYLLAAHPERCAAVMARISEADRALLGGIPELCRIALDLLASDPAMPDGRSAILRFVERQLPDPVEMKRARSACLELLASKDLRPAQPTIALTGLEFPVDVVRVLRHSTVQVLLGAKQIAADLREQAICEYLGRRLPRELTRATGALVANDRPGLDSFRAILHGATENHAMAASILHAADPSWVPEPGNVPMLNGADLENAIWPSVNLAGAILSGTNFGRADLTKAVLDRAMAARIILADAQIAGGSLIEIQAQHADMSWANLANVKADKAQFDSSNLEGANLDRAVLPHASLVAADLTGASFRRADLTHAILTDAKIGGADFTEANLSEAYLVGLRLTTATFDGARFHAAQLLKSDLENMKLPDADFAHASLSGALLTGSSMPRANFMGASLRDAGLADIEWEGANLRDADLRGANFHLGSSRSGLLFTPIASEGTRTGFYTDDFDEQSFKTPEEIRKANLCRADLRGAKLDGTDFYLVDLRGALYDPDQERHFQRCKAILHDQCR